MFFNASDADALMDRVKNSHFVHVWNNKNSEEKLSKRKNFDSAYVKLAQKFCPKVFKASDDSF